MRADIRRLRHSMELPVTDTVVERFIADVRAGHEFDGLWLTPGEEAVFFPTQERLVEASERVGAYTDRHPHTFAGTWVEFRNGGEIHVRFTDDISEHRSALRAALPHPEMLHLHDARYSYAELAAIADRILDEDAADLDAAGIRVQGTFTDDDGNRLHVEVVARDAGAARAFFRDRYGERVVVDYVGTSTTIERGP